MWKVLAKKDQTERPGWSLRAWAYMVELFQRNEIMWNFMYTRDGHKVCQPLCLVLDTFFIAVPQYSCKCVVCKNYTFSIDTVWWRPLICATCIFGAFCTYQFNVSHKNIFRKNSRKGIDMQTHKNPIKLSEKVSYIFTVLC